MDQKLIVAAASAHLRRDPFYRFLIDRQAFYLGEDGGFLEGGADIQVKSRGRDGALLLDESASVQKLKTSYYLKLSKRDLSEAAAAGLRESTYSVLVAEGSPQQASVAICFFGRDDDPFAVLEAERPTLRLYAFGLPPGEVTIVDSPDVKAALYAHLAKKDPELFSLAAQRFLRTPHILTQLFAHVMSLESKEHISYISTLRTAADSLRSMLRPRIRKVEKNHQDLWLRFYGEPVAFLDGGLSRVVGLPGTEPLGIRVGIYTVIPGERDPDRRETWRLDSYVIGDVLSDRSLLEEPPRDPKRLQEAARYIVEPLSSLRYLDSIRTKPRLLLIHGPLQNSFETYDELRPYCIPGVSQDFLASAGIREADVTAAVHSLPKRPADDRPIWNGCIAVYLLIQKRLQQLDTPVVGVVERGASTLFSEAILDKLVDDGVIPGSTRKKLRDRIKRYELWDELLFGCVLDEGEYLEPIPVVKNHRRRAHEKWELVVEQFPAPFATLIKCSGLNFPYRVEFLRSMAPDEVHQLMSLLYHMSALLPDYAFPVGIDIADKYAGIPDWLSKGVSARITSHVLSRVLQTGDPRLLFQLRRLLALSPRDFFFRPKA
jgi:hypothetical protein